MIPHSGGGMNINGSIIGIGNGNGNGFTNNGNSIGGLGLGGTNQMNNATNNMNINNGPNAIGNGNGNMNVNLGSVQRPRKILSENVPPTDTNAVQQHQQQLEHQHQQQQQQQQQNSFKRTDSQIQHQNQNQEQQQQQQNINQNNLGLAAGVAATTIATAASGGVGIGTANASRLNNRKNSSEQGQHEGQAQGEDQSEDQGRVQIQGGPQGGDKQDEREREREANQDVDLSDDQQINKIALNEPSETETAGTEMGIESESSNEAIEVGGKNDDSGGGRPLSPPQVNLTQASSASSSASTISGDDSSSASTSSFDSDPLTRGNPASSTGSTYSDQDSTRDQDGDAEAEGDQVTAIYRPGNQSGNVLREAGGAMGDQGDWAKLREAGMREREKRELERRKREGDASKISEAQAQLALTSEKVNQLLSRSTNPTDPSSNAGDDELSNLSLSNQEHENSSSTSSKDRSLAQENPDSQLWKSKKVLRSHLDSVRSVIFNPGYNLNNSANLSIVSASDDNTIKIWKLDPNSFNSNSIKFNPNTTASSISSSGGANSNDVHPFMTFRGHSAPITSLEISNNCQLLFSASLDSSIKVWKLPKINLNHQNQSGSGTGTGSGSSFISNSGANASGVGGGESYQPFDDSLELDSLIGHTQSIWDIAILPNASISEDNGSSISSDLLASVSADGTTKIWNVSDKKYELRLSWDYFGNELDQDGMKARESEMSEMEKQKNKQQGQEQEQEQDRHAGNSSSLPIPTSISTCHWNLKTVAVAYSNSIVKLFEIETGKEVLKLNSDETYDGTDATQINKVVTHPALPLLITAHEDKYIRMFDLNTGHCTLSMLAHQDAVTCLDIDPAGLTLVSGGHDCSVRFWDIVGTSSSSSFSLSNQAKGSSGISAQESQLTIGGIGNGHSAACVQEITAHRKKATEGVLDVKYHPTAPYFASAGADGVIRIYG